MDDRPIQERVLGEVIVGLGFKAAANAEFLTRYARATVYDCPNDRRAIVKDVRMIWNPANQDGDPGENMGTGAEANDTRSMELKVNRTGIIGTSSTGTDIPDAIEIPSFDGGNASSLVLEPGEKLEVAIKIDKDTITNLAEDWIVVRASGVEVQL